MNESSKTSGVSRQGRSAPATTTAAPGGPSSLSARTVIQRETLSYRTGHCALEFLLAVIRQVSNEE